MSVTEPDIGCELLDLLAPLRDFTGERPHLKPDTVLLIQMRRAELVQPADFRIDLDLFHYTRVARRNGLHFRIGERAAIKVLSRTHRCLTVHDLLDEPCLG